jgi:hypothetical protein
VTEHKIRFTAADHATMKLLDNRSRSLQAAALSLGDGECRDQAAAALEEAAAILKDAGKNCRAMPGVVR